MFLRGVKMTILVYDHQQHFITIMLDFSFLNGRTEASDPYIRGEWSSLASIESRRVWRRARAIARLKLTGLIITKCG